MRKHNNINVDGNFVYTYSVVSLVSTVPYIKYKGGQRLEGVYFYIFYKISN